MVTLFSLLLSTEETKNANICDRLVKVALKFSMLFIEVEFIENVKAHTKLKKRNTCAIDGCRIQYSTPIYGIQLGTNVPKLTGH